MPVTMMTVPPISIDLVEMGAWRSEWPIQEVLVPRAIKTRRPVQFTLRAVLTAVTLVAVWLGWLSHGARQQREGRARLASLGGEVWGYSYPTSVEPLWHMTSRDNRVASFVAWFTSIVGVDFLTNVSEVRFLGPASVHPAAVTVLHSFPDLEAIEFVATKIEADAVPLLGQLSALRRITLNDVPLTPEIVDGLSELPMLDEVCFVGSAACDNDIATLARLRRPKRLDFSESRLSWGGIWQLEQRLPDCQIMPATSSHVNDIVVVFAFIDGRGRLWPEHADGTPKTRIGCSVVAIDGDGNLEIQGHNVYRWDVWIYKVDIEGTVHVSEVGYGTHGAPILEAVKIVGLRWQCRKRELGGAKSTPPRQYIRRRSQDSARTATTALPRPLLSRSWQRD